MKSKLSFPVFFIIPLILFLTVNNLKNYQGPYFTDYQYDPSYVYLISSLNLTQLSEVKHIDHPGTTLQVIGAFVIKITFLLSGQNEDHVQDVLMDPEKYLNNINCTLLTINCLGLFFLGLISYRKYSDVLLSLLLQLTPFTSVNIINSLTLIRPENFLFFVICIFIAGLILAESGRQKNDKKHFGYLILLGIISGLGMATKLTFLPLIILPLVLYRGIKLKMKFLISLLLSFIFFVLPVISVFNIKYFFSWIFKLFVHSGRYGRGDSVIIEPQSFIENIGKIFANEWIFSVAYLSVLIALIILMKAKLKTGQQPQNNSVENKFRASLGLFLALSFQILIVSKHYASHYMFPALMLSVYALLNSVPVFSYLHSGILTKKKLNILYSASIIVISVYGIIFISGYRNQLKFSADESGKLLNFINRNSENAVTVSSKDVSSIETALFAAITYAKGEVLNYKRILNERYPSSVVYFGRCYSFGDDDKIENIFKGADKILFSCTEEESPDQFLESLQNIYHLENITIEKVFSNDNGEMVYEINY